MKASAAKFAPAATILLLSSFLSSTLQAQISSPLASDLSRASSPTKAIAPTPQQPPQQTPGQTPAPPATLPNAPAPAPTEPSLNDLGFSPEATQGNVARQALLDKRTHMLKVHQRLGLITTIPLLATVISGSFAGGKNNSETSRDFHAALGGVTLGLYGATAYYAIAAPKVPGTKTRGPIRLHKYLALVHGTGMILTPILGVMAYEQENRGEKVHGIASAHAPVGYITAIAYGAAILSVSFKY